MCSPVKAKPRFAAPPAAAGRAAEFVTAVLPVSAMHRILPEIIDFNPQEIDHQSQCFKSLMNLYED
jgi:hypothetical protein